MMRSWVSRPGHPPVLPITALVLAALASLAGPASARDTTGPGHIVGGEETDRFPSVVELEFPGAIFTGVVVGERTILTAAHGLDDVVGTPAVREGKVYFGRRTTAEGAEPERIVATEDVWIHPYFGVDTRIYYDIALVKLAEDAGVPAMVFDERPLAELVERGDPVEVVGYGYATFERTLAGVRRLVTLHVDRADPLWLTYLDDDRGTCNGDSGGPHILDIGGVPTVVAVTTLGDCIGAGEHTPVDPFAPLLSEVLDAWEGPCARDGRCAPGDCDTPDPDCGPCGFDGVCDTDCARDLDCLGGLAGEPCEADDDCASGLCATAPDDARVRYCTLPCADTIWQERACRRLGEPFRQCAPITSDAFDMACLYEGPTPGTQGAPCDVDDDCRFGVCHRDTAVCVERCADDGTCRDGFACSAYEGTPRCTPPTPGGCGCRGSARAPTGVLAALLAMLLPRRPRAARVPVR